MVCVSMQLKVYVQDTNESYRLSKDVKLIVPIKIMAIIE